jgi:hypothetical protein
LRGWLFEKAIDDEEGPVVARMLGLSVMQALPDAPEYAQ